MSPIEIALLSYFVFFGILVFVLPSLLHFRAWKSFKLREAETIRISRQLKQKLLSIGNRRR